MLKAGVMSRVVSTTATVSSRVTARKSGNVVMPLLFRSAAIRSLIP